MGLGRRARDTARDLRVLDPVGQGRERLRRFVARLHLECRPVDRSAVEARRRAGLQSAEREAERGEGTRQAQGRGLADPSRRDFSLADMDQAAKKCPRCQHARTAPKATRPSRARRRTAFPSRMIRSSASPSTTTKFGVRANRFLHCACVELAVGLGARTSHRRTLAAIQYAKLDSAPVGDPAHQSIEGVDLADEVTLAEAADRRIARHRSDGVEAMRDEGGSRAQARRCRCGLAAGVTSADDDDVKAIHHFAPAGPVYRTAPRPSKGGTGRGFHVKRRRNELEGPLPTPFHVNHFAALTIR